MGPSVPVRFLIVLAASLGLALTPNLALAQHGGGGGHSGGGGGGFHGGGGGGSHSGGGSYSGGARGSREGGSYGARSYGGGNYGRGGGSQAGRSSGSSSIRSSERSSFDRGTENIRPAINDGQWHSFGNASSARSTEGRNTAGSGNSTLIARNTARNAGISDAGRTFGSTNGGAVRGESGFVGGTRGAPAFNRGGFGWRGGWGGGWGCCRAGFGWGWGFWGFGFGWPYWGAYWGPYAWAPWYYPYYDPYWYSPWPAYNAYPDDSYNWSNDPPPYRPSDDNSQPAQYTNSAGVTDVAVTVPLRPPDDPAQK